MSSRKMKLEFKRILSLIFTRFKEHRIREKPITFHLTKQMEIHCLVLRVQAQEKRKSGGDSKEDPPVSMPNTEVKLLNVDDTWRATAWESRKLPDLQV